MVLCTTNISQRSCSPLPWRSSSDSKKESVLKHQQVPLWFWSLMDVMGFSFTVVKTNPLSFFASFSLAVAPNDRQAKAISKICFFILLESW